MSLLDLSRWQFAITVMFHMTFPAITVGLSFLLCILYGLHWRTGNPVYLQMFRFWRRIFAVGFAIGVVAGLSDRVEALGGSFEVRSNSGEGTLVQAVLPLQRE